MVWLRPCHKEKRVGPKNATLGDCSGGSARRLCSRTNIVAVTLQVTIETGAAEAENVRSPQPVAIAHLKNFVDVDLAHFIKRKRLPILIAGESPSPNFSF